MPKQLVSRECCALGTVGTERSGDEGRVSQGEIFGSEGLRCICDGVLAVLLIAGCLCSNYLS